MKNGREITMKRFDLRYNQGELLCHWEVERENDVFFERCIYKEN